MRDASTLRSDRASIPLAASARANQATLIEDGVVGKSGTTSEDGTERRATPSPARFLQVLQPFRSVGEFGIMEQHPGEPFAGVGHVTGAFVEIAEGIPQA